MTTARVPKRRGVELVMLIFAVAVVGGAAAVVDINADGHINTSLAYYCAGYAGVLLIAHLAVRWVAPYADPLLLPLAAVLNGLGLVFIHRLDLAYAESARQSGQAEPSPDAPLQITWMCIGLAFFIALLVIVRNHRTLARYAYTIGLCGLILLMIPAVLPASYSEVNGARIWIRLGGFSIQPGEFAKIALLVFFAAYLVAKRDVLSLASRRVLGIELPRARDLGPVLGTWIIAMLVLTRENDLGTSLLFFGIFLVMLYIATERTSWLLIGLVLFAVGSVVAYNRFDHVRLRVEVWQHPFDYATDWGYQIVQGLFGLGTGGLFGTGLGAGRPEMVPYANTDYITATIGEELGMFGLFAILLIYGLLVNRGFRAALSVRDSFGKLLATGLSFALALQVFIIVGGVTRLIPLTGLTTPFLSYGGSSLVANFGVLALLLRISNAARTPVTESRSTDSPAPQPNDDRTEVLSR